MLTFKITNRDLKYKDILLSKDDTLGGKNISFFSNDFTRDLITVRTSEYHGVGENDVITFKLDDVDGIKMMEQKAFCLESNSNEFVINPFSDYEIFPDYFIELDDFNPPYSYIEEVPIEKRRKAIIFKKDEDYLHYFYSLNDYSPKDYISCVNGKISPFVDDVKYDNDKKTIKFIEYVTSTNSDGDEEKYERIIDEYVISKFIGVNTFNSISFNKEELTFTISHIDKNGYVKNDTFDIINIIDEKKRCDGDIVMCDYTFLMKMNKVENNRYDFSSYDLLNTIHDIYILTDEGEEITLANCLVPLMEYGEDDKMSLIWSYDPYNDDEVEIAEYIKENFNNITFWSKNDIFLEYVENEIKLKRNVNVYKTIGDVTVNIPFNDTPDINLQQQDIFNDFLLNEIAEEHTNNIVDMEKQIFVPVFKTDDEKYDDIRKIKFNIKLKQRGDYPNDIIETTKAWVNNDVRDNWVNENIMPYNDVLGHWGFTDEDVKYQKNALKKSFIRLSFYDTNKRSTQSLLYYCTLFIDGGRLYGKYMNNVNSGITTDVVYNIKEVNGEDLTLNGSMFVVDNSDTTQSSEGFYLYLFPSLCKGKIPTTIYMKVEFNHAKFGATIPLITALGEDGRKKKGYIKPNGDISKMNELFNDIYMPINIRYNDTKNRYEWIVGSGVKNENGEFSFNLYEPIINFIEQ